jgi:hypothetical protein
MTKILPGRTPNQIKNYWHSNIRKSIDKMEIDLANFIENMIITPSSENEIIKCLLKGYIEKVARQIKVDESFKEDSD